MFENIIQNFGFILLAIAVVILQYFLRKRRGPVVNQQEIVQNLAREARLDLRMAEVFDFSTRVGRFMTTTWQLNRNKLDFLDPSLQNTVNDAFIMAEDTNQLIGDAKKYKSSSYLVSVDIDKLKGLLAKCQEGLEQWLLLKVGSRNPPERAPGMFDDLLGKR